MAATTRLSDEDESGTRWLSYLSKLYRGTWLETEIIAEIIPPYTASACSAVGPEEKAYSIMRPAQRWR